MTTKKANQVFVYGSENETFDESAEYIMSFASLKEAKDWVEQENTQMDYSEYFILEVKTSGSSRTDVHWN